MAKKYVPAYAKGKWTDIFLYAFMFIAAFFVMAPFIFMVLGSFKTLNEINRIPPNILPESFYLGNFSYTWKRMDFFNLLKNSLFLAVVKTLLQVYTSALAGYIFAKTDFRGKRILFSLLLGTMMIPWPITFIPMYQQMIWFGWINSYASIIVPGVYTTFGIFMMRQFMSGIPDSIMESGRIDGASDFRIFHQLTLPLVSAGLSALGIFSFLGNWDDFIWPTLMLNDTKKMTLPVGMQIFNGAFWDDYASLLTAATMAVIPVIIVYLIFQKQFIEGITLQGMKE